MSAFEHLLQPIKIGNLELKNRLLMTPMGTELGTQNGQSTPAEAAYYAERAKGGTGLVMTGINFVSGIFDPIAPGLARIDTDAHTPASRRSPTRCTPRRVLPAVDDGAGTQQPVLPDTEHGARSASDNTWFFDPSVRCKPLEIEEIQRIVADTGDAARRAYHAGVDVIDIHGHTGYLVDQFMSSCWNRRTDQYGGSTGTAAGSVRTHRGDQAERTGTAGQLPDLGEPPLRRWPHLAGDQEIVQHLERAGIDLLICDDGSHEAMDYVFPPYYLGDDCMVSAAGR